MDFRGIFKRNHTSQQQQFSDRFAANANANANDGGPIFGGISRKLPTSLDLVTAIDATASSLAFSQGIQVVCLNVAENLSNAVAGLTLGIHVCRDLDYDRDANFSLGSNLSLDTYRANLQRIAFEGGGDELETQFDTVQTVARTTPWNAMNTARRCILLCSTSGSKPTRDGKNAVQLVEELNALNIKVVVVAPKGVNLHQLSAGTGGLSLELSNNPTAADLKSLTQLLTRSLTQMGGNGGGKTLVVNPNTQFGHQGTLQI